jgi:hypothetical protein
MPTVENYGAIARQPIEHQGVVRSLADWAKYYQLPYKTVSMRWRRGHRKPSILFYKSPLQVFQADKNVNNC